MKKLIRQHFLKLFIYFGLFLLPIILFGQENRTYDLVIRNGNIIDGTGAKGFPATLIINRGIISEIVRDTTLEFSGKNIIDARGYHVTPGFIDTHSHGDPLETPDFENFLAMGVTTISLGQDGTSPGIDDLSNWMDKVNAAGPGVNIATFAGHNTLRQLSGINFDIVPRKENMERMEQMLKDAMNSGAFGLTTGLEYSPGEFSRKEELQSLAKIVGENKGILMSHMRNEDDSEVEASINELLELGEYCPVHISHIKVVYGKGEDRGHKILKMIDQASEEGIKVTADIYPYTASYTGIAILFPDWAKQPNNYEEVLNTRRDELSEFLRNKVTQRNGPESTLIGTGPYKGQTLKEVAGELGKSFEEVLMDDIGPYGAGAAHFIMDETLQRTLLTHPQVNICSDGSPTMRHPRSYGSFPKIIETYVVGENHLSIEEAVYKMSGLAAETILLEDRGTIEKGKVADIIIFKPEEVKEKANYEEPHQLAEGIQFVIVNGQIAKEARKFSTEGHGKVLKKSTE